MKRWMTAAAVAVAGLALGTRAWSQTAGGPVASAPASAAASRPLTQTMKFQFENASIDTVLDEMSARLGFVIQKMVPLTGKITVMAPGAMDADEAVTLLNTVLLPLGYAAVEKEPIKKDGVKVRQLRVMTWAQAKKEAPVGK